MSAAAPASARRTSSLGDALRVLDGSALQVRDEACVNLRARTPFCSRCADACPAQALTPGPDEVDLDELACTGCGACVPACPAGALALSGFDPARFLQALAGRTLVHLHCAESRSAGGGVVLPCFRLLDERLAAAALAGGTRTLVLHGLDRCGGCARGAATGHLDAVRATLTRWLGGAAPALEEACERERGGGRRLHLDQPVIGRRGFLRVTGAQAAARSAVWMLAVEGPAEGPAEGQGGFQEALAFFQPETLEQRPQPYQSAFADAAPDLPWRRGTTLPLRIRRIGDACSACMACGERCPTGALRSHEDGGQRSLWHTPGRCTDCGLCERICPHGAVAAVGVMDPGALAGAGAPVVERRLESCTRCGLASEIDALCEGVCPQCRNEQELDEAWQCMLDG